MGYTSLYRSNCAAASSSSKNAAEFHNAFATVILVFLFMIGSCGIVELTAWEYRAWASAAVERRAAMRVWMLPRRDPSWVGAKLRLGSFLAGYGPPVSSSSISLKDSTSGRDSAVEGRRDPETSSYCSLLGASDEPEAFKSVVELWDLLELKPDICSINETSHDEQLDSTT